MASDAAANLSALAERWDESAASLEHEAAGMEMGLAAAAKRSRASELRRCASALRAEARALAVTLRRMAPIWTARPPLTKRQREMLDFIRSFVDEHGYSPSFEEIAAHFGLRSVATVYEHTDNLRAKGYIRKSFGGNRSIEIVPSAPELAA